MIPSEWLLKSTINGLLVCLLVKNTMSRLRLPIFSSKIVYSGASNVVALTFGFLIYACMHAQSLSCLTLWDPMDCSLPGSSIQGDFQARILEQVASPAPPSLSPHPVPPSLAPRVSSQPRDWTQVSCKSPVLQVDSLLLSHQESLLCKYMHISGSPGGAGGKESPRPMQE